MMLSYIYVFDEMSEGPSESLNIEAFLWNRP